jgi:hypothetical protein
VPQPSSLPPAIPRLLAPRPHLAVAWLRWRNAYRLRRARVLGVAALLAALTAAALAAPPTGRALQWLAASPLIAFALSTCLFALSALRYQEHLRNQSATSWLAALPVRRALGLRMLAAALVRLAAVLAGLALACAVGALPNQGLLRLALATGAGALLGTVAGAGWGSRGAGGAPHWHYAQVPRPRRGWATAPALAPLSCWPVAQGRVFSRPSATRIVLFALLAVPAGRRDPGEVALAVGAACLTGFTLLSLALAGIRSAADAARWLAPTTLRMRAFVAAFLWRLAAKQAAVLAVVIFLAAAVQDPRALRIEAVLAAVYLAICCAAIATACARACRRFGLGRRVSGR